MSPRISIRLLASQSDQRLVALAGAGHERAFEALVHRYRRPLLRYARHRMRLSESRAEDVLQQSFMQVWIALSRGASVRDVRSWLYRIVHNTAVNAIRGPEAPGELTQAVQDRAGLASVSNLERTIAVRDALGEVAALPAMQQQAIFLTAVDGQSHEQVAGALGISPGAVRGLLYRARTALRSAAAALTPPPVLAWACSAGSPPASERLIELSAGSGGVGIAGLIAKGAVVAATAGAVASGAAVLGAGHDHGAGNATRATRAHVSSAGGFASLALASRGAATSGAGESPAARSPAYPHRGRRGHGRSDPRGRRGGSAGEDRHDGRTGSGGNDTMPTRDGGHRLVPGSVGRDGSGDLRGSGDGGTAGRSGGSSGGDGTSGGGTGEGGGTSGAGTSVSSGSTSGSGDGALGSSWSSGSGSSGGGSSGSSSGDGLSDGGSGTYSGSADASTSSSGSSAPAATTGSGSDG